ncbi:MAG: ATP-binding protein [Candidatus Marinimicrobia bacterium]|nr:ATP-binding protein [Candidatus Neomarinimicrobiota bacterium]
MKFVAREKEIEIIHNTYKLLENEGLKITLIKGYEGVGKTTLALEATKGQNTCYLKVNKKAEKLLCKEFMAIVEETYNIPIISNINNLEDFFSFIMAISRKRPITFIFDEFQVLDEMHDGILKKAEKEWKAYKKEARIHLVFISSDTKKLNMITEKKFKKFDNIIDLHPFTISEIKQLLESTQDYSEKNLLSYYIITGGIPKYISILQDNKISKAEDILPFAIYKNSPFINEGINRLIKVFGRNYGIYFTILQLAATGTNRRSDIEDLLGNNIGGYMKRLDVDYGLIKKVNPANAEENARRQRIFIKDIFLNFWFRFIYRNSTALESGDYRYLQAIQKDFHQYRETMLKQLFAQLLEDSGGYTQVGFFWEKSDKKYSEIIAINEKKKILHIYTIKMKKSQINEKQMEKRADIILKYYQGYNFQLKSLTLEDLDKVLMIF